MLGVRHHAGCAIDLWCGDPATFVADVYERELARVLEHEGKHVVLTPSPGQDPENVFLHLRAGIKPGSDAPRRITVILPDLECYKQFQAALFRTFPELDHD